LYAPGYTGEPLGYCAYGVNSAHPEPTKAKTSKNIFTTNPLTAAIGHQYSHAEVRQPTVAAGPARQVRLGNPNRVPATRHRTEASVNQGRLIRAGALRATR